MRDCCTVPAGGASEAARQPASDPPVPLRDRCPHCGAKGKKVGQLTVKAMLAVSLRNLKSRRYRFCRTASCPVVYFAEETEEFYTVHQLRERVFQKEPGAHDVRVCYCFAYTPATIRQEYEASGKVTAVEVIEAGVKAGQCACEVRNPQGSCCLGNVRAVVEQVVGANAAGPTPAPGEALQPAARPR